MDFRVQLFRYVSTFSRIYGLVDYQEKVVTADFVARPTIQ